MKICYRTIYAHLKSKGFDVYSPGQHKGLCTAPYLVLRNAGTVTNLSISSTDYEILTYYPADQYSHIEDYVDSVRDVMNELYPGIRLADDSSEPYLDEEVRAFQSSLLYRTYTNSKVNRYPRSN